MYTLEKQSQWAQGGLRINPLKLNAIMIFRAIIGGETSGTKNTVHGYKTKLLAFSKCFGVTQLQGPVPGEGEMTKITQGYRAAVG